MSFKTTASFSQWRSERSPLVLLPCGRNSFHFIICPENYSQLQPLLAFMCPLCVCVCVGAEGGDNQKVLVKVIAQGHRLTARITVILPKCFLPLHPVLHSTGAQTHYKNKNHTTKCFPSPTQYSATPVGLLCNWGTECNYNCVLKPYLAINPKETWLQQNTKIRTPEEVLASDTYLLINSKSATTRVNLEMLHQRPVWLISFHPTHV